MSVRVSVAMAVYNGEKFLQQQIDSIIEQLDARDELVARLIAANKGFA